MKSIKTEKVDDIIEWLRKVPVVFGYQETTALADRLAAAIERERADWKERIAAGIEVADAFKKELDHVLNLICFHQHKTSPNPQNKK